MQIFGIAGWSGSGKTTLMQKLIPELTARGISVSTIKHAHHNFDIDKPGKDSYEHRAAGAREVMITSTRRWALMHEIENEGEPTLAEAAARMSDVDLLLVEGFKHENHVKMEIHRGANDKPLLQPGDPHIIAVASDVALAGSSVPVLGLDDVDAIAGFILDHCGLAGSSSVEGAA